jgi:hypothetical protein
MVEKQVENFDIKQLEVMEKVLSEKQIFYR